MSMEETKMAIDIVGSPRFVLVNGKRVEPTILLSPALGEGVLVWLAQSISRRLHDSNLVGLSVIANSKCVSGCLVKEVDYPPSGNLLLGDEASKLLLLAESVDQILAPSRRIKDFDYGELIVNFRLAVLKHNENGAELSYNDNHLNDVVYHSIQRPLIRSTRPAQVRRGAPNV